MKQFNLYLDTISFMNFMNYINYYIEHMNDENIFKYTNK